MKVIIGLGNPGDEYKNTRHNVGFMFLDNFQKKHNFEDFKVDKKFNAEISTGNYKGEKVILVKPLTYMNLSGQSVLKIMSFYKIDSNDIIVISDDISMIFGKTRIREKGSAGGHNGLKSIIENIGEDFKRIKVGIGYDIKYELPSWVLAKFSQEEMTELIDIFDVTETLLDDLI